MEDFAAIQTSKSERNSPNFRFEPAQTMSDDDKSIIGKGHQHHTLAAPFRGSDEENQAEESQIISKDDDGYNVPYKWDTLLDPFISPNAKVKSFPDNEIILSDQTSRRNESNPLQEKRSTSTIYTPSQIRSTKPMSRSRKDQRQSQSSTRSVLSKATRDLIFNESTDSSDVDHDGPLTRVDSIEEVVPLNLGMSQMSRESFDDHDERKPVHCFKITKTKGKQRSQTFTSLSPSKSQVSLSSSGGRSRQPDAEDQEKASQDLTREKNVLAQQHPFTLTNLFANSCLPSKTTHYESKTKNDILAVKTTNNLSFLTEVFQCGNQYDDDAISPRNTQLILDAFDKTLCGIPAKMANISLDDLLHEEESEDDLDMHRSKSGQTRPRSKKSSTTTPTSISKAYTSSTLYGVLKEHMNHVGAKSGDPMGSSIDNDPQVQRELERLCKLLEAKLDSQGLEPAYESDGDDYYDDESESDYDDEEDKLFESWVRSGPIMDLFGIGCNAKHSTPREITYDDRITSGRSYHRNERFYPDEEDEYSDDFDEDYYSDAESTGSNLTVVAAGDYK